jgi:hypothetical protein
MTDTVVTPARGKHRLVLAAGAAAALSLLALAPTGRAAAEPQSAAGPAAAADTCWATHYGAEIPPGSFTASGEIFDAGALTAATSLSLSPQLPFGTQVKVTNTANGASVTVRINDRGTFTSPVCIDLSDGAFSRLAALSPDPGHIVVTEEVVSGSTDGGTGGGTSGPTGAITGYGGKCVDVAGANSADGTPVQLYTCNGTAAQNWTVGSDGTVRALGKCLDVTAAGTANGTKVQLYTCNGTSAQSWTATAGHDLVNPHSGRCLDATGPSSEDGTRLQIWDCGGGANQKWNVPS